jgi:hypothetical protein
VPGEVSLRLSLRDLAGNEGTAEKAVSGPGSHHDHSVISTGGVGPPAGGGSGQVKPEPAGRDDGPLPPVGTSSGQSGGTGSPSSLPALQVINRRQLKLGFDVSKVGPSGLGAVEVYVTEDDGQTWSKAPGAAEVTLPAAGDARQRGAVTVGLARDGVRYGYYLVIKSRAGLGKPAPQPGTPPQVRVELDTTLPEAKLYAPEADPSRPGSVVLRWEATDRNLAGKPITLEWSESGSGPWSPIGEPDMANAGKYSWQINGKVPPQVYLKLTVRDAAGNTAVAQTDKPVPIDVTEPELSNVSIEPAS